MVIFIRKAAENLHILEVVFFRNLLAFIVMIPILKSTGLSAIKMNNIKLFFMRGFFGAIGMLAGFTCLTLIPLAQATAISFSKPIFITIGATIFLGEIIKGEKNCRNHYWYYWNANNCSTWGQYIFVRNNACDNCSFSSLNERLNC